MGSEGGGGARVEAISCLIVTNCNTSTSTSFMYGLTSCHLPLFIPPPPPPPPNLRLFLSSLRITECHSVAQRKDRSTSVHLEARVSTMEGVVRPTAAAV